VDVQSVWLRAVEIILRDEGLSIFTTTSHDETLALIARERFDVLMIGADSGKATFDWVPYARKVRKLAPAAKLIVVSADDDPPLVRLAFELGADAYVVKRAEPADLVFAIRQVMAPALYQIRPPANGRTKEGGSSSDLPRMTPREGQIVRLVARGRSNAEIASALDIREATVKGHLQRLYRKLGVSNRTAAALLLGEPKR
jgi:DNA-binding NarL/FixJ family response regulator